MTDRSGPLALDPVVLTGVGVSSSLGGLVQAAAAFRAGLVRVRELDGVTYVTEDNTVETVQGHVAPGLNHGYRGAARLAHLARAAARDLPPREGRIDLLLTLPKAAAGYTDRHRQTVVDAVSQAVGEDDAEVRLADLRFGRPGPAAALARALSALTADATRTVMVGAVDSLVDPERIAVLAENDRLARADQPAGLVPGESACFLQVERLSRARDRGVEPLARVERAAVADDIADDRIGIGMTTAIRRALAGGPAGPLSVYVDTNGEPIRAKALGHALMHLSASHDVEPWRVVTPGPGFGDVGVAGAPLAAGLAVRAAARGYAVGSRAVIATTPDDDGIASAFTLSVA